MHGSANALSARQWQYQPLLANAPHCDHQLPCLLQRGVDGDSPLKRLGRGPAPSHLTISAKSRCTKDQTIRNTDEGFLALLGRNFTTKFLVNDTVHLRTIEFVWND